MNGFQRFALLVLCILAALICYPYYTFSVWPFMALILGIWSGVIMALSVLLGLFGLDRFNWVNSLVTVLLVIGIAYSILCFMPQEDNIKPITRIRHGQLPSYADMQRGVKRLTFNFDFNRRNARSQKNFINQQAHPVPLYEEPQQQNDNAAKWRDIGIRVKDDK